MKKIVYLTLLPFYVLFSLWLSTIAFHKLSEKSDLSVIIGILLLTFLLFILLLIIFYGQKLYKNNF